MRSAYHFEGICLTEGEKTNNLKNLNPNNFTEKQTKQLTSKNVPLQLKHQSGNIGHVRESWIGNDGKMHILGTIYTDNGPGKQIADDIHTGKTKGLSMTHDYTFIPFKSMKGYGEYKKITEISIVPLDKVNRPGCEISFGYFGTIEDERCISVPGTMEKKKPMADELTKMKEQLAESQKTQQTLQEALENLAKQSKEQETQHAAMIASLTERDRKRFTCAQEAFTKMFGDDPSVKAAVDSTAELAKDIGSMERVGGMFNAIMANMANPEKMELIHNEISKRRKIAIEPNPMAKNI